MNQKQIVILKMTLLFVKGLSMKEKVQSVSSFD